MFSGCITALITPFKNGALDIEGLRANIKFQLSAGVSGLLVCGSTGEAPNLLEEEWQEVVRVAVAEAGGKTKVLAGAGTNSTAKSIKQVKKAEELGVDGVLIVAPYYNKPTQEGLYRHFRACAEATKLPVIIYNIPPRSVVNVLPVTVERLAKDCSNIMAVKEASGSIDQSSEIVVRCGERVVVLSGDDSLTLPILAVGGKGVISVVSNIVPGDVEQMVQDYLAGRVNEARQKHLKLFPLVKALFVETNPIPVKAAMNMLGMAAGEPRLPLCPLSKENEPLLRRALAEYGLLIER
ncbi:MAG: 4-hydroxy-tetrahydrodipicolinate synthase [candidate division WOR-3 bacterium]|jgi:4-hydroxy-tetrahydrodipicolinate synthase|nr:4-hydroxy-tetrahydrodipicolinate synthase [candidate division WOR-3 bacterium]MCR4423136.1 4-hydroxy-tetrahydrodipicolinate synthase [candidate division WOR-3 bacterium]MDH7518475.1 4-hydroxy-tetrahydrodipicolinate synthase [bacterium]